MTQPLTTALIITEATFDAYGSGPVGFGIPVGRDAIKRRKPEKLIPNSLMESKSIDGSL